MSEADNKLVASLLNLGEERMGELAGQLLAHPKFSVALERAIDSGVRAKKGVDDTLSTVLSAANVPTTRDLEAVDGRLGELEESLIDIEDRLRSIYRRLQD